MKRLSFMIRPPLIMFLVLVLASSIAGIAIFNYASDLHTSPARTDYFRVETQYLRIDFPKNWYAVGTQEGNETSGNSHVTYFVPAPLKAILFFRIYDSKATQTVMEQYNLTDALSINTFEIKEIFRLAKQGNANATLSYEENGTMTVLGHVADYSTVTIKEGLNNNGVYSDITGTFISFLNAEDSGKMTVQIIFYGEVNDWSSTHETFMAILGSTQLK